MGGISFKRGASALRAEPLLVAFVVLAAIGYATYSLVRYAHLDVGGFDLGIFDQTVWHLSRFETPANSVRGVDNIWGDHFSPILALLAPLYWIWEDARLLLLAQALLLAVAAVPIFIYVNAKLGRVAAYLFALAYLAFWGLQSALSFDFHELAFAPLLIALLLLAIERRRWVAYFPLLIALLCVKEDLSILVVFVGIYVMSCGALRQGLITIALGIVWYLLVLKLLIPHLSETGDYAYWSYEQFGDDPLSALAHALTHPDVVVRTLFDNGTKTHTLRYLAIPFLGLMLCSRTAILLIPLVAQRFLSTDSAYWNTGGHYALAMAAILFIGAADGLSNVLRWAPDTSRRLLGIGVAAVVLVLNVAFTASLNPSLTDLARGGFYETPAYAKDAERALQAVPDGVSVAAQDNVITRLAHRDVAAQISPETGTTDYIVARIIDNGVGVAPNGGFGVISRYLGARLNSHVAVAYVNGWLVMRSKSLPPVARAPQLVALHGTDAARIQSAYAVWLTAFLDYGRELARCLSASDARVCLRPLGRAFRLRQARLERELQRVRPTLKAGCLQLVAPAAGTARLFADTIEAARDAGARGNNAELTQLSAGLEALQARDATGYITRFVALCTKATPA